MSNFHLCLAAVGVAIPMMLAGCPPEATEATETAATTEPAVEEKPVQVQDSTKPADRQPKDGDEVAVIETDKGKIVLMFFPDKAPKHVENFKSLAKEGFYDGTRFHRCIPGFMIQGGDPNSKSLRESGSWGTGGKKGDDGSERRVVAEFNDTEHLRGVLSMARSGHPDSASSQFFIVTSDSKFLDRQYTAFGKVVSGIEVADEIVKTGDAKNNGSVRADDAVVVKSIKVVAWPVK